MHGGEQQVKLLQQDTCMHQAILLAIFAIDSMHVLFHPPVTFSSFLSDELFGSSSSLGSQRSVMCVDP